MTTPTGNDKVVAALRASLTEAERLRRHNQQLLAASRAPIAIVGMACRFPGGAGSPEGLWRLVDSGTDAIAGFPVDRGWDLDSLYDPDPDRPGTSYVREGGFVYEAGDFDAGFFGISPREALAMDPQQRLLLEVAWETFERAGIDVASLRGRPVGTFVGGGPSGYGAGLQLPESAEGYSLTGSTSSVVSGRIAYTLGLEGPAVTVDTACSSSLVALHLACQSLRQEECTLALAGGVAVMCTPTGFVEFSRQRGLAQDGRCKPFAAAADGTGWGEGAGMLLLERLSDARRNGHRVLAVVRGSAVNQDGASNGLTAPNGPSQQRVIRAALANAGLATSDVDAVEAHGTGTTLGDPIEAQALLATYGQGRPEDRPLWIGSVKSNLGHAQYSAGVAGVIKMVMALQQGVLPRTLHVDEPTPQVDWSAGAVRVLAEPVPWPETDRPRRAGVSAFGISGTNAHVVLEQAPAPAPVEAPPVGVPASALVPWVVSAASEAGLAAQAVRLAEVVDRHPPVDVARALAGERAALSRRAVVWGADREALLAGLEDLDAGSVVEGRLGLVFTGQGAQRRRMGVGLAAVFPVYAEALAEVCAGFAGLLPRPLEDVLADDAVGVLDETVFTQAGLFAVEVAGFRLLESWGVVPDFVAGHSIGELTAAHVAGLVDLRDACRLVAARGSLMQGLPAGGVMLSVQAGVEVVSEALVAGVDVAAVNGPAAVVVSGPERGVARVEAVLAGRGVKSRRLRVSHAFHSSLVEPMLDQFAEVAAGVSFGEPRLRIVSTVTGAPDPGMGTAGYWVGQVRRTVRYGDAVEWMQGAGVTTFVEVGPDAALSALGGPEFVPTSRRDRDEVDTFTRAVGRLWTRGVPVDWDRVLAGRPVGPRVDLPTYAFQRQRYWLEPATEVDSGPVGADPDEARFWDAVEREDLAQLTESLQVAGDEPLRELLPRLSGWRRRRREQVTVDGYRYRVGWRPVDVPAARLSGDWLALVPEDGDPLADAVLAALARHGAAPVPVPVQPAGATRVELGELIREEVEVLGRPPAGVLSLLDCGPVPAGSDGEPGLVAAVALVQALGDAGVDAPLWTLTSGAVRAVPDDPAPEPARSLLWGFGRVVAVEWPDRWGGLVDMPATVDERGARLLAGLLAGAGEDQVAIRPAGALARRLAPAPADPAGEDWRPTGTTLVTGGTGALGAEVARWLAGLGAEHLLLLSRRGPEAPGAGALAAELRELGSRVTVVAADAADRDRLAEVLGGLGEDEPLTAVFHTAGVVDDGVVAALTPEQLQRVLRPKVAAARALHELTRDQPLTAFVLFSSFAGTVGTLGQGAYAAANAFLDALAEQRRDAGLPATSVAWGPWAGAGMAADAAVQLGIQRTGLAPLDPQRALSALRRAIDNGDDTVAVVDVDWGRFAPAFTAGRPSPLLADVPAVRQALGPTGGAERAEAGAARLRQLLGGRTGAERGRALLDLVREQVAAVLGHRSGTAIDPDRPFKELGFTSLAAVELRNRLSAATEVRLPITLVFDYPSSAALARYLGGRLDPADATANERAAGPVPADEPVAVVGLACRLPGGVETPADFWRLLAEGGDAITPFPADRGWDIDELYDPDPGRPGRTYGREGGFVGTAAEFDASFFGISPREAAAMDPQQRLLLETSWQVVENAGIDPASLRGTPTAVYAGVVALDYAPSFGHVPEGVEGFIGTGNAASVASGRVAYTLGLEGPAVTLDTACSSSLVAIHLAAQSLRQGECSLALAGGATVLPNPGVFVEFSRQQGLSVDGRCRAFSAAAGGLGPAEGAGMLLLERLSDARRNGRRILAVLRGSAINQDGASNGLTAPNGPSQQRVIRAALASAGLRPSEVDAVEAHGTGTTLGDPIEAQALLATYGQDRPADRPLWLGSVKSNIGHTQAAAGVAGVIKMILAMQAGTLPQSLHIDEPTPHVDWSSGAVSLLAEPVPWTANGHPRRCGVSSFGISGTNAHVILEEGEPAPAGTEVPGEPAWSAPAPPWVLSARDPAALRAQAGRLAELAADPDTDPVAAGWALLTGRSAMPHRAVAWGADREALAAGLAAVADGAEEVQGADGVEAAAGAAVTGSVVPEAGPGVVFVFPGHGSQWHGMGRELLTRSPAFAARIDDCDAALAPYADVSVRDLLAGDDDSWLEQVNVVQPVLWAMHVSLAAAWAALGVVPAAVVGHSQGEIAAAVVAGGISLDDAARVTVARSAICRPLTDLRGMLMSVAAGRDRVEEWLRRWPGRLAVGTVNGPTSTLVSGEFTALEELAAVLTAEGIWFRVLKNTWASHSPQMEQVRDELLAAFGTVTPRPLRLPMASSVTGELVDGGLDAGYWYANLRQTVLFQPAVEALARAGHTTFVEVSAHPVITGQVLETLQAAGRPAAVSGTLRRHSGGPDELTASAARLWVAGAPVDWSTLYAGRRVAPAELPGYPFQRRRYWLERAAATTGDPAGLGLSEVDHPLLGAAVSVATGDTLVLTGRLSLRSHPWLGDHAVADRVLLPGSALVELAVRAGDEVDQGQLTELTLQEPLPLPASGGVTVQVVLDPPDEPGAGRRVSIHSRPDGTADGEPWTCHAEGRLAAASPGGDAPDLAQWPPAGAEPIDVTGFYPAAEAAGYGYGPAFQGLRAAWRRGDELFAEVVLPEPLRADAARYGIHPALLDAALHVGALDDEGADGAVRQPYAWNGATLLAAGATEVRVRHAPSGPDGTRVTLADPAGRPVADVAGLVRRTVDLDRLDGTRPGRVELYSVDWVPAEPADAAELGEAGWAVLGDDPLGVAAAMQEAGHAVAAYPDPAALVAAVDAGTPAPAAVLVPLTAPTSAERIATLLDGGVVGEGLTGIRLVAVTRGAVLATAGDDLDGLEPAAAWDAVRTVQRAVPGRIVLVDVDGAGAELLPAAVAVAVAGDEPRVAVRDGRILVPRVRRAVPPAEADIPPAGAVLLAGTGPLAEAVAARLVGHRGVRRLTVAGPKTDGIADLVARLGSGDAAVELADGDPADRDWLVGLLAAATAAEPVAAVVDTTGDAGTLWHLHELTADQPVALIGCVVAPDAAVEAICRHRRAGGRPALALSGGDWPALQRPAEDPGAAVADAFSVAAGLDEVVLYAARLDRAALRRHAELGDLPAELRELAGPAGRRRAATGGDDEAGAALRAQLATAAPADRLPLLTELVRGQAAEVLGFPEPGEVEPDRPLKELGFDSMMSVRLRNRLAAESGLTLPATLVFTYPTPAALADYLLALLLPDGVGAEPVLQDLERLEAALASLDPDPDARARIGRKLQGLLRRWTGAGQSGAVLDDSTLASVSDDEMFDLIDRELGA